MKYFRSVARGLTTGIAILATSALSGCSNDTASFMVAGKSDNAFTLFREKAYPGAAWGLALTLTHLPDCQRRHPLKPAPGGEPYKAELFRTAEGGYVLHSADAWYEARLEGCTLREIKPAPVSPGEPVGSWEARDGTFKFFPAAR